MATIDDLDEIIAKLRKVQYGDIILTDDHNDLVDAVKVIRDLLGVPAPAPARVPSPLYPSNLDPNDPAWTPREGWSKVYNFETFDELLEWANDELINATVTNSVVHSDDGVGMAVSRLMLTTTGELGVSNYKFAVCFAIPRAIINSGMRIAIYVSSNYGELDISLIDESPAKLVAYDPSVEGVYKFWNTFQWLVLFVDFENGIFRVFDHNKNIILEGSVHIFISGTEDVFWLSIRQEKDLDVDNAIQKIWTIFVDWFCEYYAVPHEPWTPVL